MSYWDGRYCNTKESEESLEETFIKSFDGNYCTETSTGGVLREHYNSDGTGRIDVYGQSDSSKGHSHAWYESVENYGSHD